MTLQSMTAYGYGQAQAGGISYVCEIRTLNARFLEVNVRLPRHLLALEIELVNQVKASMQRGKVDLFIDALSAHASKGLPELDPEAVSHYGKILSQIKTNLQDEHGSVAPLDVIKFLSLDGILLTADSKDRAPRSSTAHETHREPLFAALKQALKGIDQSRRQEGGALAIALTELLDLLETRRLAVAQCRDQVLRHLHQTYTKRLEAFLAGLAKQAQPIANLPQPTDERLMTELAMLADKADIDEELTRLATHISEFRRLMNQEDAAGRKLDFLCQEMHREVNTMSNKLLQTEVSQHTIEMKQTVERIRQQVQNIE